MSFWQPRKIECADCKTPVIATAPKMKRCKACQAASEQRGVKRAYEKLKAKRSRQRAARLDK